jgi:quercetin dioxygenase-like cupin family protein
MKYMPHGSGETIYGTDYSKRVLFPTQDFEEEGHLLQVVSIPPRTKQRLHSHRQQTEVFYILEGEALMRIEKKEILAKPGDAFICSPGDRHNVWNQSDSDFKLVVFKIGLPKENDTDWIDETDSGSG